MRKIFILSTLVLAMMAMFSTTSMASGSGGKNLNITAKNDGHDFVLPDGYRSIDARIADGAWSKYTYLPKSPEVDDVVRIHRVSTWDAFVAFDSYSVLIPSKSEFKFVFDGTQWNVATDVYEIAVGSKGSDIELPNNQKNINVNIKNGAWVSTVNLPKEPSFGDIVTVNRQSQWGVRVVVGSNLFQSIDYGITTYSFDGKKWKSSLGNEYQLLPDNTSNSPMIIPNDRKNIVIKLSDGLWQKHIKFPNFAPLGSTVTIDHRATYVSYVDNISDSSIKVPYHSISKYLFDGDKWHNVVIEKNNTTQISDSSIYEIDLDKIKPTKIKKLNIEISNLELLDKQGVVSLNEMSIESDTFFNRTPYEIISFYAKKNGEVFHISFDRSVPEYSSVKLFGYDLDGSEIINTTKIANNKYVFNAPIYQQGQPEARHANMDERNSVERVQMYERYWINAPETMGEILEQIDSQCATNGGYSECANYEQSKLDYAGDMYFAQSVSNLTTQFWIDPTVWGLATSPNKELNTNKTNNTANLWMSPMLMANMLSGNASTAVDAEQGLIHEYYHNLGFSHNSGWPSDRGIDNLFGRKAYYVYRTLLENNYKTSNLVVDAQVVNKREFLFDIKSIGDVSDVKLRLLSTSDLNATIEQINNKVRVKFNSGPQSNVYVSFYSKQSTQMSTVTLSHFAGSVSGQGDLENLTNNFSELIDQYDRLFIHTANGKWIKNFNLPENVDDGKVVIFMSNATYSSDIYYSGSKTTIKQGQKIEFSYQNGSWII